MILVFIFILQSKIMQGYLCLSNLYISILPLFTLRIAKKFDGHCCLLLMITDKCQNIHILALNLHLLTFLFLLFCSILFSFCVFCVFVSHERKESISGNLSIKGQFWASSILLLRSSAGD